MLRKENALRLQDQMFTTGMGGVLPEQPDPARFQTCARCRLRDWRLVDRTGQSIYGDVLAHRRGYQQHNARLRTHAAAAEHMEDRIEFPHDGRGCVCFEFPRGFFDLVNQRAGSSYLRTWDWPACCKSTSGSLGRTA